ncbi:MAG: flagellar biosynthesis anti-sigma factor FlgM [Campylobacterota bacterium]|nr:flagellar biosynthesis anti-sigma factor FlgM [Campylobacterota bacterium]
MVSNINSGAVRSAFQNSDVRSRTENGSKNVSEQGDASKIESLKASIENGEYKINLEALAKKIADELL